MNHSSWTLYFDNDFTSIDVLKNLSEMVYGAARPIRENGIHNVGALEESNCMRRNERGKSSFVCENWDIPDAMELR